MAYNLSSYQILTNSILCHWLLFTSIDHRRRHAFPLSFLSPFFSLNVCGFCCWICLLCVCFFYRCSHFSCAVFYWFGIIIDVRFTVFFSWCCCCLRGTSVKPMVKPNKLQQLFMFLVSFSSIASNVCNLITLMIAPMVKWTQQSRRHNKNQTNIMKQKKGLLARYFLRKSSLPFFFVMFAVQMAI